MRPRCKRWLASSVERKRNHNHNRGRESFPREPTWPRDDTMHTEGTRGHTPGRRRAFLMARAAARRRSCTRLKPTSSVGSSGARFAPLWASTACRQAPESFRACRGRPGYAHARMRTAEFGRAHAWRVSGHPSSCRGPQAALNRSDRRRQSDPGIKSGS